MQTIPFIAHGVWGIWDEVLPALLVIGFVVIFIGAAVISRLRDTSAPSEPPPPTSTEQSNSAADHYRLD